MPITTSLAFRIYGTTLNGTFSNTPLAEAGTVPDSFMPSAPVLVKEDESWRIVHTQDYTLYSYMSRQYVTADNSPAQLLVCLFFPPKKRLAEGKSPLELIETIHNTFKIGAIKDKVLPDAPVNIPSLQTLLPKYRLEARPLDLPLMQGLSPAAICMDSKSQLDAMFRHSRYPVLAGVGSLEMGFKCVSTISLRSKPQPKPATPANSGNTGDKNNDKTDTTYNYNNVTADNNSTLAGKSLSSDDNNRHGGTVVSNNDNRGGGNAKKIAALVAVAAVALLGLLWYLGSDSATDDTDISQNTEMTKPSAEQDNETVNTDSLEAAEQERLAAQRRADSIRTADSIALAKKKQAEQEANMSIDEQIAAAKKKAEEARKKAEEARRKADEARRKEAASSRQNTAWQAGFNANAAKCPMQHRLGVKIISMTCTATSAKITVRYEQASKYDSNSFDKNEIRDDLNAIRQKYCSGIPSNVNVSVYAVDKMGRPF